WLLSELAKLAGVLMLGMLLVPRQLGTFGWSGLAFAILVLLLARPLALGLALLWSALDVRERLVAAWFGPRGFASIFYGLWLLHDGAADVRRLFHIVALVVTLSIVLHSSSDVPIARWLRDRHAKAAPAT